MFTYVAARKSLNRKPLCIQGPIDINIFPLGKTGSQFVTGECIKDSDCTTGCCGQNNKCRNPLAFNSDSEFCQNGLTVDQERRLRGGGNFLVLSPKAVPAGVCVASVVNKSVKHVNIPNEPVNPIRKANEFICVDDTNFKMFTSEVDFVMGQCPKGFCFTRSPPIRNPCVGRANAIRIDL
jgi:hypothetical protein